MIAVFRTVLDMSITGAFIAAAIILLRQAMKKLPKRYSYMLWLILAVRLLCPVSLSSAVSMFNLIRPETEENRMSYIPKDYTYIYEDMTYYTPELSDVTAGIAEAVNNPDKPAENIPSAEIPYDMPKPPAEKISKAPVIFGLCAYIWLAGAAVMALYTVTAYALVHSRVKRAVHMQDNVYICTGIDSPFVYGIIRPRIYLPADVPADETAFILAHENAHIRRGDHIVKLIAMAALSIHWFNPLAWVSYKLMIRDMELSCDETAVRGFETDVRKSYAETLLNMSMRQNKIVIGGILGFGESSIKTRVKSVLTSKKPTAAVTAAAILIVMTASACMLTNSVSDRDNSIINMSDYKSFSVHEYGMGESREITDIDASEIINIINSRRCGKLSAEQAAEPMGAVCYSLRMYRGEGCEGDYDRIDIVSPAAEPNTDHFTYFRGDSKTFYGMDGMDYAALALKMTSFFGGIAEGIYMTDEGDFTLYISAPQTEGDIHMSLMSRDIHYYSASADLKYTDNELKNAEALWFMGGGGEALTNTGRSISVNDGGELTVEFTNGFPVEYKQLTFRRINDNVTPAPEEGSYSISYCCDETVIPANVGREMKKELEALMHTELSRNDAYAIPSGQYDARFEFKYAEKQEDGSSVFGDIMFLSPVNYDGYRSDTKGTNYKYLQVITFIQSPDPADSGKLSDTPLTIKEMTWKFYSLTDEEYNSLYKAYANRCGQFPEGRYVSAENRAYSMDVIKQNNTPVFTLYNGDEIIDTIKPDTSELERLRLICGDSGASFDYLGGGRIRADNIPVLDGLKFKVFRLEKRRVISDGHSLLAPFAAPVGRYVNDTDDKEIYITEDGTVDYTYDGGTFYGWGMLKSVEADGMREILYGSAGGRCLNYHGDGRVTIDLLDPERTPDLEEIEGVFILKSTDEQPLLNTLTVNDFRAAGVQRGELHRRIDDKAALVNVLNNVHYTRVTDFYVPDDTFGEVHISFAYDDDYKSTNVCLWSKEDRYFIHILDRGFLIYEVSKTDYDRVMAFCTELLDKAAEENRQYIPCMYYKLSSEHWEETGRGTKGILIDSKEKLDEFYDKYLADVTGTDYRNFLDFLYPEEWFEKNCLAAAIIGEGSGMYGHVLKRVETSGGAVMLRFAHSNNGYTRYNRGEPEKETQWAYLAGVAKNGTDFNIVRASFESFPTCISEGEVKVMHDYLRQYYSKFFEDKRAADNNAPDYRSGFESIAANNDVADYAEAALTYSRVVFGGELKYVNIIPDETSVCVIDKGNGRKQYLLPYSREICGTVFDGEAYFEGQSGYVAYFELIKAGSGYKVSKAVTCEGADYMAFGRSGFELSDLDGIDIREGADKLMEYNRTHN